ncbi:MAG: hypothetical protein KA802_13235 [Saprospiraceae bacterium]|nr:hypothetical protein [Saprospiraceae bacterium]
MTRETFSIEHKVSWLNSNNPVELYFDLNNISFSHLSCNISDAASKQRKYNSKEELLEARRQKSREWKLNHRVYDSNSRKERYKRCGT